MIRLTSGRPFLQAGKEIIGWFYENKLRNARAVQKIVGNGTNAGADLEHPLA
ncbi:MAG TPA: hypothetical protein VGK54_09925 [Chloroflexota bacterium]